MCPRRNGKKGTVIAFALFALPKREQEVVAPKDALLAKMEEDKFTHIAQTLRDRWQHAPTPHSLISEALW